MSTTMEQQHSGKSQDIPTSQQPPQQQTGGGGQSSPSSMHKEKGGGDQQRQQGDLGKVSEGIGGGDQQRQQGDLGKMTEGGGEQQRQQGQQGEFGNVREGEQQQQQPFSQQQQPQSQSSQQQFGSEGEQQQQQQSSQQQQQLKKEGYNMNIPQGARFTMSINSQLNARVLSAKNLVTSNPDNTNPFVKVKFSSRIKSYQTDIAHKTVNPQWNHSMTMDISNVQSDIVIFEVWDKDRLGADQLIGFVPIDPSVLPRGSEVTTWEKLSYVPSGELNIAIMAINFGLESVPNEYPEQYEQWRQSIPNVQPNGSEKHKSKEKEKEKGKKEKDRDEPKEREREMEEREGQQQQQQSGDKRAKSEQEEVEKCQGPYHGKTVPHGYLNDNGWVKKKQSISEAASQKIGKGLESLKKAVGQI